MALPGAHGPLGQRQRQRTATLVTGRPVGEGFDHPPLDTLLLAMPVFWQDTLEYVACR